jgi:hypothetical protein
MAWLVQAAWRGTVLIMMARMSRAMTNGGTRVKLRYLSHASRNLEHPGRRRHAAGEDR